MHPKKPAIAYYITPHGFGHAVRSLEVLRRLAVLAPEVVPTITSDIPDSLVAQNLGTLPRIRRLRLDVGLHQHDSIRFDLEKSLALSSALISRSESIIDREVEFLRREHIRVVVSDIGWLPFEAAHRCGIPSIGMSNFTWDWIYSDYAVEDPRWVPVITHARRGYEKCSLFLRLPMHGDCSACPKIEDVPLVARLSLKPGSQVRSLLGFDPATRLILLAFASLDLGKTAIGNLKNLEGIVFLYKSPMKFDLPGALNLEASGISFPEAVGAADAVLTKPGYGIISDCIAHATPMIYTERGRFIECEVLVETIRSQLPSVFIDSKDFSSGNWENSIRQILSLPRGVRSARIDGADVCARKILALLE